MSKPLYRSVRWARKREAHLRREPLCRYCLAQGVVRAAQVVDHVVPHKYDPNLFWRGDLQSLCADHHNKSKQSEEIHGYSREVGADGMPVDPSHPVNVIG